MSFERLAEFREAIIQALRDGQRSVRIDVGAERTRLVWSRAGLEIISGDGVDVMLSPDVLARILQDMGAAALALDERTEWVDAKEATP